MIPKGSFKWNQRHIYYWVRRIWSCRALFLGITMTTGADKRIKEFPFALGFSSLHLVLAFALGVFVWLVTITKIYIYLHDVPMRPPLATHQHQLPKYLFTAVTHLVLRTYLLTHLYSINCIFNSCISLFWYVLFNIDTNNVFGISTVSLQSKK